MLAFLTCNGYTRIATAPDKANAPAICRRLERQRNDGYAVIANREGRIVADADGWTHEEADENRAYRAGYDRACGY